MVSSSVVSESEMKDEGGGCEFKQTEVKGRGGWEQRRSLGENDTSVLLSSAHFDGPLKRAAESPQSEINGLKLERDMKPAVAYKNTQLIHGGEPCVNALPSGLSPFDFGNKTAGWTEFTEPHLLICFFFFYLTLID